MEKKTRNILVADEDSLTRNVIVYALRELNFAQIQVASSAADARQLLIKRPIDGLLLSLDDHRDAVNLLTDIRLRSYPCSTDIPVVVCLPNCTTQNLETLKTLQVRRLLLKPFKLREVLSSMVNFWPELELA